MNKAYYKITNYLRELNNIEIKVKFSWWLMDNR